MGITNQASISCFQSLGMEYLMMLNKVVVYAIPESSPQLIYDMRQAPTVDQSAQLTSTHFHMDLFAVLKKKSFDILHNSNSNTEGSAIMQK